MAKKSKTQRAKASAARAARKERAREVASAEASKPAEAAAETEAPKKSILGKLKKTDGSADENKQGKKQASQSAQKAEKKIEKKAAKKNRFQFFKDVRSEMRRVTWPTRQDILRWSVVVVCALLFFGIYVAVLDNGIITPLLVLISGLGA